jgi:hypothetical protein
VDFIFLSKEKNPKNRERLYENFNPCFSDFKEFDPVMQACTQNRETFVLDNHSADSDKVEDNCFWFRSKFVPGGRNFRVNPNGTWWKFHRQKFDPKHYLRPEELPTVKTPAQKRMETIAAKKAAAAASATLIRKVR